MAETVTTESAGKEGTSQTMAVKLRVYLFKDDLEAFDGL